MLVGTWGGMVWVRRGSMGAKVGGRKGGRKGGKLGKGEGKEEGKRGARGRKEAKRAAKVVAKGEGNSEADGWARKGLSDQRWVLSCCWGCCRWEVVSGAGRTAVSFLGGGGGG